MWVYVIPAGGGLFFIVVLFLVAIFHESIINALVMALVITIYAILGFVGLTGVSLFIKSIKAESGIGKFFSVILIAASIIGCVKFTYMNTESSAPVRNAKEVNFFINNNCETEDIKEVFICSNRSGSQWEKVWPIQNTNEPIGRDGFPVKIDRRKFTVMLVTQDKKETVFAETKEKFFVSHLVYLGNQMIEIKDSEHPFMTFTYDGNSLDFYKYNNVFVESGDTKDNRNTIICFSGNSDKISEIKLEGKNFSENIKIPESCSMQNKKLYSKVVAMEVPGWKDFYNGTKPKKWVKEGEDVFSESIFYALPNNILWLNLDSSNEELTVILKSAKLSSDGELLETEEFSRQKGILKTDETNYIEIKNNTVAINKKKINPYKFDFYLGE